MQIGDIVKFDYREGAQVHQLYPSVLVLHDNWRCHDSPKVSHRCMHGLNFNYLSPIQRDFIHAVVNPTFEREITKRKPDIGKMMEEYGVQEMNELTILSPYDFYKRFIRDFIKPQGWDPYRRYRMDKMRNTRSVIPYRIMVGDEGKRQFDRYRRRFQAMRGRQTGV